ncbi:MAG: lamin tail domain-containing protein [Phycisphaerales bacterium]
MRMMTALLAVAGIAGVANADITINEVLGSTPGTDYEFIELFNTGASAVSLTGWTIELWDSDTGGSFGGADGGTPYALSGSIAAGGYWTLANALAQSTLGFTADQTQAIAIENSSYTMVLRDASSAVIETIFVWDSGVGDAANIAGTPIVPDYTAGPDGSFLPAGFYRNGDASPDLVIFEFDDASILAHATPGSANIPAPASLALLGIGCMAGARRRRA